MSGNTVRQFLVRRSVLPTLSKNEIDWDDRVWAELILANNL